MIVRPLPVINPQDNYKASNDVAPDGYPLAALERLLADCQNQPDWRAMADLCCAYYDGNQLTSEQIYQARKNNLEPRSTNLIARVINGVLGQEAKARRDPVYEADDDADADVADVLQVKLKEAQRETNADMAISNGYAGQVKAGISWVEVSRSIDPNDYPYYVGDVHRSEMFWDWRAKRVDVADARWMCRAQWKDTDEIMASFPKHAETIRQAENNWAGWMMSDPIEEGSISKSGSFENDRAFRVNRHQWIDGGRRRIRMYEVWYKVPAETVVMKVGQRWIPLDLKNPVHMEAVARTMGKMERRTTMQIRRAIFAGPFRLLDEGTTRKRYPYIPFMAFRTDSDNSPYGLIHGMLSPQDEFNERRLRIQWMLKAQQLLIDSDALDDEYNNIADIAATQGRPDMVAILNPERKNVDAMRFRNDLQLQKEQFDLMQDAKGLIQDVPGVYGTQLGDAPSGVTSGLAINSLVEQGLVAMGELNDNYAMARRLVFESLSDLIVEDHLERDMQVAIGSGSTRRTVVLNTVDKQTRQLMNVVRDAGVKLGLGEVPASPAYQMQMSQMMGDMIRNLAGTPHAGVLIPSWVEQTAAFGPSRKQLADDMRRIAGLPTAGDRQGAQAWQAQQQKAAAEKAALEAQAAQIEIKGKGADAALAMSRAGLAQAQRDLALVQADALANDPNEQQLIDQAIAEAMPVPQRQAAGGQAPPASA